MLRRAIATILIDSLLGASWAGAAPPSSAAPPPGGPGAEPTAPEIEQLGEGIDRAAFDLAALLERHDYDPDAIVRFVREEIRFEPYAGLLRGAQGTLMSRAGNALDQAVLLATLLGDAGHDTRIGRARVTREQARRLLRELRAPSPETRGRSRRRSASRAAARGASPALDASAAVAARAFRPLQLPDPGWEPPSSDEVSRMAAAIAGALERDGVTLGDPAAVERLETEAEDYFWVEHRAGSGAPWRIEQPVFARESDAFSGMVASQSFSGGVPAELQHRVRVEAFIEQKVGRDLRVHSIMAPWERPAANLIGRVVTFANYPSGLEEEPSESTDWKRVQERTDVYVPLLDGRPAPGASAFDDDGMPFSLDVMGMDRFAARSLFDTMGEKVERAVGALDGLGRAPAENAPEPMELTAQWVDFTVIAPGGAEVTERRMILDRLGADARTRRDLTALAPMTALRSLIAGQALVVVAGRMPDVWFEEELVRSLTAERDGADDATSFEPLFLAGRLFEDDPGRAAEVVSYHAEPSLLLRGFALASEESDGALFFVDLLHNRRRTLRVTENGAVPAPLAAVRQGVWETFTEASALVGIGGGELLDTRTALGGAMREGARPVVLRAGSESTRRLASPDLEARIAAELAKGRAAVVLPESGLGGSLPAWWRVDPASGHTVGITADGRGGALEYIVVLTIGVAVIGAIVHSGIRIYDSWQCEEDPRVVGFPEHQKHCHCMAHRKEARHTGWAAAGGWCSAFESANEIGCNEGLNCYNDNSGDYWDRFVKHSENRAALCQESLRETARYLKTSPLTKGLEHCYAELGFSGEE